MQRRNPQTRSIACTRPGHPTGRDRGFEFHCKAHRGPVQTKPQRNIQRPVHGKVVTVSPLTKEGLFSGIDRPFKAVRYNSLNVETVDLPKEIRIDAYDDRGDVMAVSVTGECTYGVQFHPESFLTEDGDRIVGNFLREAERWRR